MGRASRSSHARFRARDVGEAGHQSKLGDRSRVMTKRVLYEDAEGGKEGSDGLGLLWAVCGLIQGRGRGPRWGVYEGHQAQHPWAHSLSPACLSLRAREVFQLVEENFGVF
jgi:hypothetical protein